MFKPYERISGAKEMMQLCTDNEATSRAIIHQSYYAAFNQLGYEVDNRLFYYVDDEVKMKSVHKAYIDSCKNKKERISRDSGEYGKLDTFVDNINRLRGLRRRADYNLDVVIRRAEAELSILQAEKLFNILEELE